jgi:AAHS family 4-hydroxybenzoate transporter-like MFS transporter
MLSSASHAGAATRVVNVDVLLDGAPVGITQRVVFLLCFLVSMLDGFDTQSLAFIAPSLVHEWGIAPASLGAVFSATLLGSMFGFGLAGRLADRFGRRRMMTGCVLLFGLATLACATAATLNQLLLLRVIAGLGLGGALPNMMVLAAEYAPRRMRATAIVLGMWGYPLGAVVGGLFSATLIAHFGWRSVLVAGGIAPLLLVPMLLVYLPESLRFLAGRATGQDAARRILRRLRPQEDWGADLQLVVTEAAQTVVGFRALFVPGYAASSVLFAASMFMSLLLSYLLVNWIPQLLHQQGMSVTDSVYGTVVLNLAGIVGSYFMTRRVDANARPLGMLVALYCAAAAGVAAIGMVGTAFWLTMAAIFVAGFLLIGVQMTTSAVAAGCFPTTLRATAVGWIQGVGRVGSLFGPLTAGALLSLGMKPARLLIIASLAALMAAAALALLMRYDRSARDAH